MVTKVNIQIYESWYKSNASYFLSESIITVILNFTCILYKVEIIFPQSLLHYQHTSSTLMLRCCMPLVLNSLLKCQSSSCTLHFISSLSTKQCPWSASFMRPKQWKSEGAKLDCREDEAEQIQGADFCE
jgi:hypothetical protein